MFPFLDLPSELRLMIYHMVFQGAQIWVIWPNFFGQLRWQTDSSYFVLARSNDYHREILITCKFVRAEAMAVLAMNTSIYIADNPYRKIAPVALEISSKFRAHIQTIEYAGYPRFHLDFSLYSNLKLIVLQHKVYHCHNREMPAKSDGVSDMVKTKVARFDNSLMQRGVYGLEAGDGIKVQMKVWLLNSKARTCAGWDVLVDARD